jgi:hypothetical protein
MFSVLGAIGASLLLTPITTVILWLVETDAGSRPLTEYFFSRDYLYLVLLKTALSSRIYHPRVCRQGHRRALELRASGRFKGLGSFVTPRKRAFVTANEVGRTLHYARQPIMDENGRGPLEIGASPRGLS